MPGSVSDSYDPEWGTGANGDLIRQALANMHAQLGPIIGGPPIHILDVVRGETVRPGRPDRGITATLSERQWRVLRFACERAQEAV